MHTRMRTHACSHTRTCMHTHALFLNTMGPVTWFFHLKKQWDFFTSVFSIKKQHFQNLTHREYSVWIDEDTIAKKRVPWWSWFREDMDGCSPGRAFIYLVWLRKGFQTFSLGSLIVLPENKVLCHNLHVYMCTDVYILIHNIITWFKW